MIDLPMDDVIREYRAGMSTVALGEKYGVHHSTIARRLGKANEIRSVRDANRYKLAQVVSLGDLQAMATELGLSPIELREILVRHGFMSAVATDPAEIAKRYADMPPRKKSKPRPRTAGQTRNRKVFIVGADGRARRLRKGQ